MSKPRKGLVVLAGVSSILFAVIMLAMAGLMFALESPVGLCILFGSFSILPILIAVACFAPRMRSVALRILGGIACLVCCLVLIQSIVARVNGEPTEVRRLGFVGVAMVGSGIMAWKGKWPGAE